MTALMRASENHHTDVVRGLVIAGANLNLVDNNVSLYFDYNIM